MKNSDKPIYPCIMQQVGENSYRLHKDGDPREHRVPTEGLTKREYFALNIFTGLCVPAIPGEHNALGHQIKYLVPHAVELADALLNKLDNQKD